MTAKRCRHVWVHAEGKGAKAYPLRCRVCGAQRKDLPAIKLVDEGKGAGYVVDPKPVHRRLRPGPAEDPELNGHNGVSNGHDPEAA